MSLWWPGERGLVTPLQAGSKDRSLVVPVHSPAAEKLKQEEQGQIGLHRKTVSKIKTSK